VTAESVDRREAVMAEAVRSREQALEWALEGKRAQGYRIESHDDTQAVLLMRARRRFFNLRRGDDERYLLAVDERGHATSRRIESAIS
jgi:hypothetical protein